VRSSTALAILQFADAERLGPSEWRLSKLLRGRRGTEWAMGMHQVGETVLAFDPAALIRVSSLDKVGLSRFYRAVSIGSDPSLPDAVAFTNEAASLKPYAPVHIRGSRNGGGDVTITWIRRTRFSGEWRDLVDVPLNEASEAYAGSVLAPAARLVMINARAWATSAASGLLPALASYSADSLATCNSRAAVHETTRHHGSPTSAASGPPAAP
jgi:hypothetical protein